MAFEEYNWTLGVGATLLFLNCCVLGANTLALAWGPTIGAKAVSYQVAAPAGALCAFIGALFFGERSAPLYGGYLHDWSELKILPELTMYSMIWPPIVALIWQALALWWQVPVIYYLGHASAMVGIALVYPGWKYINWGGHPRSSASSWSLVPGLGAVYVPWGTVPVLTILLVTFFFLILRMFLMRGEDPFHKVLWCLPGLSCLTAMICVAYILYTISFPSAWNFNTLSPQGVVIVLCSCGIGGLCVTLVMLPGDIRRAKLRAPTLNPVKHMNLLGLDDDTLLTLNVQDPPKGFRGWMQTILTRLFVHDINNAISKDETVMHIHSSGEDFDSLAESCFMKRQFITCCLLSMGHAAETVSIAANCFAVTLHIHRTGEVPSDAAINWHLRLVGAVGMVVGILLGGWRLVPVSGVQISKMTPFRSFVITIASTLTSAIVFGLQVGGGMTSQINISSVWAVGLAEGASHVNWRRILNIVCWWIGSLIPVFLVAAAMVAQGLYPPSVKVVAELVQTETAMQQAMAAIALIESNTAMHTMDRTSPMGPRGQAATTGQSDDLLVALQQAIAIYEQALAVCPSPATG